MLLGEKALLSGTATGEIAPAEQPGSTQCLRAPRAKLGAKAEKLGSSRDKLSPPFPHHANSRAPRDAAYGGTKQLGEGEAQSCGAQSAPLLINLLQSPLLVAQTLQHRAGDPSPLHSPAPTRPLQAGAPSHIQFLTAAHQNLCPLLSSTGTAPPYSQFPGERQS